MVGFFLLVTEYGPVSAPRRVSVALYVGLCTCRFSYVTLFSCSSLQEARNPISLGTFFMLMFCDFLG